MFLASSVLFALMVAVMLVPNAAGELLTDWGGPHVVHDLMFTLFAAMVLVGLAAQVGAPRQRVAAMTLVVGFPLLLTLAGAATGFVFPPLLIMLALAVLATLTHPTARELLRPQARPHVPTLVMALVWLVPAVVYAADHLALQHAAPVGDEHAEVGHWVGAAVIVVLVPLLTAVGGLRGHGWRVPGWFAAGVAVLLGAFSIGFPTHASSFGVGWGVAAIVWGLGLAVASLGGVGAPGPGGASAAADRAGGPGMQKEVEA